MQETLIPTRKPLRGPAGLDAVLIDSCTFTEGEGKREPRPPLFSPITPELGVMNGVFLAVNGGKVLVKESTLPPGREWKNPHAEVLGTFRPTPPQGPPYTGRITPAMWAQIRKWWNP